MKKVQSHIKPNFFIVGAPKAGTTSLYNYLTQQPEVFMCNLKETNYFSSEELKKQKLYYKETIIDNINSYEKLFIKAGEKKAIGEASVSYLYYPSVAKKIIAYSPNAKILIVLRDPTERAYSHYLMDQRLGFIHSDFSEVLFKKKIDGTKQLFYQQYVELGFYYKQIKTYINTFGKENVKIFLYEELKNNTNRVVEEACEFLGVEKKGNVNMDSIHYNPYMESKNQFVGTLYKQRVIRKIARKFLSPMAIEKGTSLFFTRSKPKMDEMTRKVLRMIYKEDILQLEYLIEKKLESWYCE